MSGLDDLPPLREVVAAHGLSASKKLGQHYLFDLNLTGRVARAAGLQPGEVVIEIGPGPGGLTRALFAAGADCVIAVEKDTRFAPALADIAAAAAPRRLIVEPGDALKTDLAALAQSARPDAPAKIVANLPYNVGTALLVQWLTGPAWWRSLTLMFQREVADRIVAPVGDPAYGRLGVLSALRANAHFLFPVSASAFSPPPKVESGVVHLTPRDDAFPDVTALETVTRAAFGQRRKMLRRSLKSLGDADALLDAAALDGDARPETIAPEGFAALAQAWRATQPSSHR